jgi:hypothetical protein
VSKERVAKPRSGTGALDQPGDVGDRRSTLIVAEVEDAEVRLERGEGIVGDLGFGGRDGGEDGRLAGIGQADESDVGDQPELQAQPPLFARLALLGMLGCLVGGRLEVGVAEAASTTLGDERELIGRQEVREKLAGAVVVDRRPGRDRQHEILAGLAVASGAGASTARLGLEVVAVLEVPQRGHARVHAQFDRTAAAAVAAVGAAPGNMGFLAERGRAIPAVAGVDPDLHMVKEHPGHCPTCDGGFRSLRRSLARGSRAG